MESSGWPECREASEMLQSFWYLLCTKCYRHQVGTARPIARSDRRKCSGAVVRREWMCPVSSLERIGALVQSGVCAARGFAKSSRVRKSFLRVKVVPHTHTQGVPQESISGDTLPGAWRASRGRPQRPFECVPTAMDGVWGRVQL